MNKRSDGRGESLFRRALAVLRPGAGSTCALSRIAVAGALAASSVVSGAASAQPAPPLFPSSADAVRAACAVWGEQILAENTVRSAAYQEQFSYYSMRRGRCYVEMQVQTIASSENSDRVGRFLYDGQTKELLAFAQIRDGKKSGRVFDLDHRTTTFENGGWDDACGYIDVMMADDR